MWFQIVSSDIADSRLGELCCDGAEESKRTPGKSQFHARETRRCEMLPANASSWVTNTTPWPSAARRAIAAASAVRVGRSCPTEGSSNMTHGITPLNGQHQLSRLPP